MLIFNILDLSHNFSDTKLHNPILSTCKTLETYGYVINGNT